MNPWVPTFSTVFVCVLVTLLGELGTAAGGHEDDGSAPALTVRFPQDRSTGVALPLHIRYAADAPCRSALALDGLVVSFFEHVADGGLTADVRLPSVSLDRHTLSLDVVDASGRLLRRGPRWSIEMEVGARPEDAPPDMKDDEPVEPYDPNMSQEEMAQAELVDGWWLVKQDNFEFTRPEPADTCEDVPGWRSRTPAQGPRRIW